MIEKNKEYYKAQVKKLKAKNKTLKEDNSALQCFAGIGWGMILILVVILIIKCL